MAWHPKVMTWRPKVKGGIPHPCLELVLDEALVREGLERVQHDDDEVARARRADHLPPAPLAVLGSLDDSATHGPRITLFTFFSLT